MKVKKLMKKPYIVEKDITFFDAAKLMSSKEIGSLVYLQKNKVRGIITHTDLMKNFGSNAKISTVFQSKIITIDPEDDVETAIEIMREEKIRHIPVVENDNLIGIITATDIAMNVEDLQEEFFFNE